MQHHFPFVVICEDWTVPRMLHERPHLLLAAVSNAASQDPDLQERSAKELKDAFAQQIMRESVTSLDVLQALLVYLAWHQYYLIPRSMQIFKYMQMAIGVFVDLGLDSDFHMVRTGRSQRPHDHLRRNDFRTDDGLASSEAERTALGCFYLSGVISSSMNRPNSLSTGCDTLQRCRKLCERNEIESDIRIVPLMEYQHLLEDVFDAFKDVKSTDDSSLLPTYTGRLADELDAWWNTVPRQLQVSGLFKTRYYAARVRIYEMGILFHFRRTLPRSSQLSDPLSLEKGLLTCVEAIKQHLDAFLAIDFTAYTTLPFEEWTRLVISCFILYKLAAGHRDIPSWNAELCPPVIDFEAYLTAIARRIRSTRPSLESLQTERDELYYVLPLILETARDTFKLSKEAPLLVPPGHPVHVDLSRSRRDKPLETAPKCPATGFWVDKAFTFDHATDWSGVGPHGPADPAALKVKSDLLWNRLLGLMEVDKT